MACYGLKSLYPIADICASTRYHIILPDQQPHPHQPNQVEVPPEPEQMDIEILNDLPDVINVPEEVLSDLDYWTHSVLEYQW